MKVRKPRKTKKNHKRDTQDTLAIAKTPGVPKELHDKLMEIFKNMKTHKGGN